MQYTAARYSLREQGDSFVIYLPETDHLYGLSNLGIRILQAIEGGIDSEDLISYLELPAEAQPIVERFITNLKEKNVIHE